MVFIYDIFLFFPLHLVHIVSVLGFGSIFRLRTGFGPQSACPLQMAQMTTNTCSPGEPRTSDDGPFAQELDARVKYEQK